MRNLKIYAVVLALTPVTAFAYDDCDPYEGNINCGIEDVPAYEPREEVNPHDYIEQPTEMPERFKSNEDFIDHYCMMEGYRAAICR